MLLYASCPSLVLLCLQTVTETVADAHLAQVLVTALRWRLLHGTCMQVVHEIAYGSGSAGHACSRFALASVTPLTDSLHVSPDLSGTLCTNVD